MKPGDSGSVDSDEYPGLQVPERLHTKDTDLDSPVSPVDLEKSITEDDLEAGQRTPAVRTVTAQDWTGPDDPENPHNWPMTQRIYHTIIPALFAFAM